MSYPDQPIGQPGTDLATPWNADEFSTGLEDFSESDFRMPRITIDHESGLFVDSLSKVAFPAIDIIPLGMIKGRVLWNPAMEEDGKPLCKSTNNTEGYPTLTELDPNNNFPWRAAGWQPTDFAPNEEGRTVLPCLACPLKEWGTHPIGGKKPWCVDQHTIPVIYAEAGNEPSMVALFKTQRTSIKASLAYFAGLKSRKLPAFAYYARVTLQPETYIKKVYYVPSFQVLAPTAPESWGDYSRQVSGVRLFLTQPPRVIDNAATVAADNQFPGQMTIPGYGYGPQADQWASTPPDLPPVQPQQTQWAPPAAAPQYAQPAPIQQAPPRYAKPAQPQQAPPQYAQPTPVQQPPYVPPVQQPPVQLAPPQPVPPVQQPPVQQLSPGLPELGLGVPLGVPMSTPPAVAAVPGMATEEDNDNLPF